MIINGGSRRDGGQLGMYLTDELKKDAMPLDEYLLHASKGNEQVRVLEVLGVPTDDVTEALIEMDEIADAARASRKNLYHAQINPEGHYDMTDEQWVRAVDVLAEELGLAGQPRVIVLHVKNGRAHAHVAFQRTDPETLNLISDSWNYIAHERASRRLEMEFGHKLVQGVHIGAQKIRRDQADTYPLFEDQRAVTSRLTRAERKDQITTLYRQSDSAKAFISALQPQYTLAQGDKRGFVLVARDDKVYGLSRYIDGATPKQIAAFLHPIAPDDLPTVEQARLHNAELDREMETRRQQKQQPPIFPPEWGWQRYEPCARSWARRHHHLTETFKKGTKEYHAERRAMERWIRAQQKQKRLPTDKDIEPRKAQFKIIMAQLFEAERMKAEQQKPSAAKPEATEKNITGPDTAASTCDQTRSADCGSTTRPYLSARLGLGKIRSCHA